MVHRNGLFSHYINLGREKLRIYAHFKKILFAILNSDQRLFKTYAFLMSLNGKRESLHFGFDVGQQKELPRTRQRNSQFGS